MIVFRALDQVPDRQILEHICYDFQDEGKPTPVVWSMLVMVIRLAYNFSHDGASAPIS